MEGDSLQCQSWKGRKDSSLVLIDIAQRSESTCEKRDLEPPSTNPQHHQWM